MIKRLLSFLFRLVVVIALMGVIAVGTFEGVTYYLTGSFYDLREARKDEKAITKKETVETEEVAENKNMKNTLFFVESKDGLSRYTALVMMNKETKATDILLIPLHVQVTVGGKLLNQIQEKIPSAASTLELDDIARAYGDEKYPIISDIFSQTFAVTLAGYDVISQENFEKILDLTNPVSYNFTDLLSYRNDKQELKYFEAGEHDIDGEEAMILMSHMDGTEKEESDRLERSNTYLESWVKKMLDNKKGGKLVSAVKKVSAASPNRDYTEEKEIWTSLSPDAVTLRILQGAEKKGVFSIDSQKAKLQIATLVKQSENYDASDEEDSEVSSFSDDSETVASSKDYYVELYNAAFREGLASEWESFLEGEGYNISLVDSYQDEGPISTTRIIVSQEGMGQDLLKYFPNAEIETGEIETGGDIQVYIGTDSTDVGVSESYSESEDEDEDSDEGDEDKDKDEDEDEDEDKADSSNKKKNKNDSKKKDDDKDTDKSGYYNFAKDSE